MKPTIFNTKTKETTNLRYRYCYKEYFNCSTKVCSTNHSNWYAFLHGIIIDYEI